MERILALAKKVAQEAEVFLVTSESVPVQFETNRLKHIQSKQSTSVSLRLIKDGRFGYAATTDPEDAETLVNTAAETARFGMPARCQLPGRLAYPDVPVFDPQVEQVTLEQMVEAGEKLISLVRRSTPELICGAGVAKGTVSVRLMNSRGGEASYRKSVFSLGLEGTLVRGTDMLFVGDSEVSCHPLLEPQGIAGTVVQQLERARSQAPLPSGTLPVLFTPHGVASALISPLMSAFNGKTVLEGASPLKNRLGEMVFDPRFSLWDDPILEYQPESRPSDDEGVPSQRTPLVSEGRVMQFFYDLQTAALADTRSTGNGSRGRGGLPTPAPSAFVLAAGSTSFEDLVADIKEGLIVEEVMGAEQGNILGGDFSGNVLLGYKVESGRIVGRVKNTMVSGNVYQLLKEIAAIGSDIRWVGGSLRTPSLYFSRVSVASK